MAGKVVRPQIMVALLTAFVCILGLTTIYKDRSTHPATVPQQTPRIGGLALPLSSPPRTMPVDCAHRACVALTFDDGPSLPTTPQILDTLQRQHVRATFFVLGVHIPGNEQLLRRMYQEGHEIGNHSWNHTDFTKLTPREIKEQIAKTQALIADTGVPAPTLFRPPYGATNPVVEANVPMTIALWNNDPEDWDQKHPQDVIAKTKEHMKPGRVVVMHDTRQQTAESLEQLIHDLRSQQYELVTFSELFDLPSGQRGKFYGR
jgi:peptidoglycan-N-acetylglucosamine deacetylase